MRTCFLLGLAYLLAFNAATVRAQEAATQDAAPEASVDTKAIDAELDEFRDDLFHAFNTGDYPAMLEKYCHKDIIATWQDGTTSEGHAGVIAEFDKLKQFIDKMTVDATTDKRLILNDGNLVISSGEMKDRYELGRGPSVNLNSRWSATLIKDNDRWLLASFSASTNAFDNEVVSLYLTSQKYTVAAIAGIIGLGMGLLISLIMKKRSNA
ncbi:MAG: nuclear transport factor 2 family protein [Planctomycetaceae bacterium]